MEFCFCGWLEMVRIERSRELGRREGEEPRSAPEGELSLPGVTQDVSAPFRRLLRLLLTAARQPCTVQHTPVTHPRYPEGC